jgi:hypothetical protein
MRRESIEGKDEKVSTGHHDKNHHPGHQRTIPAENANTASNRNMRVEARPVGAMLLLLFSTTPISPRPRTGSSLLNFGTTHFPSAD